MTSVSMQKPAIDFVQKANEDFDKAKAIFEKGFRAAAKDIPREAGRIHNALFSSQNSAGTSVDIVVPNSAAITPSESAIDEAVQFLKHWGINASIRKQPDRFNPALATLTVLLPSVFECEDAILRYAINNGLILNEKNVRHMRILRAGAPAERSAPPALAYVPDISSIFSSPAGLPSILPSKIHKDAGMKKTPPRTANAPPKTSAQCTAKNGNA